MDGSLPEDDIMIKERLKTKRNKSLKHILEQCIEQFVLIVGEHLAKIDGNEDQSPGLKRQKTRMALYSLLMMMKYF